MNTPVLLALSTLCFLGGFSYAVVALRTGLHRPSWANLGIMIAGFLLQCLVLRDWGALHGRCPITNAPEVLVFLGWSLVLLYFILGRAFRLSLLGVFTAPLVFLLQTVALVLLLAHGPYPPEKLVPTDIWHELHAAVSLLSFGAFGLAAMAGLMYLVQDRQLKSHHPGQLFYSLPPIRYLTDAIARLLGIGLILLSGGIVSAYLMNARTFTPHVGLSAVIWAAYAGLLTWHFLRRGSPKRFAGASVVAFLLPLMQLALL